MSRIRPQPTRRTNQNNIFSHKDLETCSHVFIRKDFVKRALSPPYEGPFPVVSRSSKTFTVKINDQNKVISVNRLKPAFIENTLQSFHDSSILPPMPDGAEETTPKTSSYTTRYGRHIQLLINITRAVDSQNLRISKKHQDKFRFWEKKYNFPADTLGNTLVNLTDHVFPRQKRIYYEMD
ncbi:transposition [Cordylochernes scorpioides]|uniref:Transposition n=1 Tax=Cordylochernes scorpioides TaxID=51811 RepID=A0ABY6JUX5_9ARAC|nr:transposition [Cordylochernes scorpioides]